jgi:hypothetical protein
MSDEDEMKAANCSRHEEARWVQEFIPLVIPGVKILAGIFCMTCVTQGTMVQWYSGLMGCRGESKRPVVQWFNGVLWRRQATSGTVVQGFCVTTCYSTRCKASRCKHNQA